MIQPKEIERKFLVKDNSYRKESYKKEFIKQGFLSRVPERTVRIRIKENKGYITVKGKSEDKGTTRFEWEKEILLSEAELLLNICEKGVIEKERYYIQYGSYTFEVDEFQGLYKGLILAEIELKDSRDKFDRPLWLGKEVTQDIRYYNSYLSDSKNLNEIQKLIPSLT